MQTLSKTWFISDLHLDATHPEIISQFKSLLISADASIDAIYILGDLFEVWIGDDEQSALHTEITQQLKNTASRGTKIYVMRGNRDFLLGSKFLAASGCTFLSDEEKINLYGTPVLLMHGDTLCTQDVSYQRARKFMHNKILQSIFLFLPISFRKKIAAAARKASTEHTGSTEDYMMDVTQSEVERVMQAHDVNFLIHGHTHRPAIHTFTNDDHEKSRIVLPAWHGDVSVFEWRSDNSKNFVSR